VLLRAGRHGLQMVLRLLAHNAEHWLASHLNAYLRDDDKYRAITANHHPRLGRRHHLDPRRHHRPARAGPRPPASPAPWPCPSTRSTPPRQSCPLTTAPITYQLTPRPGI
jgi:hypothetical protein